MLSSFVFLTFMTLTAQPAAPSHETIAASIDIPAQPQLLKAVQQELQ